VVLVMISFNNEPEEEEIKQIKNEWTIFYFCFKRWR